MYLVSKMACIGNFAILVYFRILEGAAEPKKVSFVFFQELSFSQHLYIEQKSI
jgi:hypothetical protein